MACLGVLAALGLFVATTGQARPDFISWNEFEQGGGILRANLDGSGRQSIITGQDSPSGWAFDLAGGKIYWIVFNPSKIWRANLDGSGQPEVLVRGLNNAGNLQLDLSGGQMYWVYGYFGTGGIQRANLDGSGLTTLVSGVNGPLGVTLDVPGGKMYFSQGVRGQEGFISRYNLDGSGRETLLRGLSGPTLMALDVPRGKIYWGDAYSYTIRRANLDGSAQEILVTRSSEVPGVTLDVARGKLYWTEINHGSIGRANLDGSQQETVLSDLHTPVGIVLQLDPIAEPVPVTGFNADVISDQDPSVRFAQPFNAGTFAWFESGAVDDNGVVHNDGLPAGLTLLSATGNRATYQIQPANANNVLQLSAGQTGTLTLTMPAVYSTLYILASSGDGTPSSLGSGTINFADGSTQAFSYNCFDWCNVQGRFRPEAVFTGPIGRADVGPDGTAFVYNQDCDFQVYETIIAIDPSHAGVGIASIDFTAAADAFYSNIFGVSGQ
jgi:low density lipoprotein receptor-related protein 5/6